MPVGLEFRVSGCDQHLKGHDPDHGVEGAKDGEDQNENQTRKKMNKLSYCRFPPSTKKALQASVFAVVARQDGGQPRDDEESSACQGQPARPQVTIVDLEEKSETSRE